MVQLSNSPVFLIGYRGTGKSTVAARLADRLGCDWVDSDAEVERRAGKSIADIFAEEGEPAFRELEERVVAELCRRGSIIVALGGGAVLKPANREAIRSAGPVVHLAASAETISERLAADPLTASRRPNLTKAGGRSEIALLLAERLPIYRECATFEVDTEGRTPDEVAEEILQRLSGRS